MLSTRDEQIKTIFRTNIMEDIERERYLRNRRQCATEHYRKIKAMSREQYDKSPHAFPVDLQLMIIRMDRAGEQDLEIIRQVQAADWKSMGGKRSPNPYSVRKFLMVLRADRDAFVVNTTRPGIFSRM